MTLNTAAEMSLSTEQLATDEVKLARRHQAVFRLGQSSQRGLGLENNLVQNTNLISGYLFIKIM